MLRKLASSAMTILALTSIPAVAQEQHDHGAHSQLGSVTFPLSCNPAAQAHFTRATAWLHSFEYEEAERSFAHSVAADPDCAIGYWGVAMSQYHPLWAPPTAAQFEKGQQAIKEAQKAPVASVRERAYIAALATFFDRNSTDYRSRTFAYERAMEEVSARYPSDREASIFYALSLIAAGMIDDDAHFTREKRAAEILNKALADEPDHPGVAHYIIHSYDFPPLALLALPAARRYAGIAPASAHAQHMPSHIFTRLGLWEEAIQANLRAEAAARGYAQRHELPGSWDERLHAMDYLAYAYLQSGQNEKARNVLLELGSIKRVDPANFKVAYAFAAVPARYALERKQWEEAAAVALSPNALRAVPWPQFRWAEAHIHFARAVGAARTAKTQQARQEIATLAAIRKQLDHVTGNYDWGLQVEIQRQVANAWLDAVEGRQGAAISLMRAAAELDDATEKHPVTPGQILPAREQLAEMLLLFGNPTEALVEFERTLEREPGRFNAVYGAARAAREAGDLHKAGRHYEALLAQVCGNAVARSEVEEARVFLGQRQPQCRQG